MQLTTLPTAVHQSRASDFSPKVSNILHVREPCMRDYGGLSTPVIGRGDHSGGIVQFPKSSIERERERVCVCVCVIVSGVLHTP
ncbi:hypothetical protein BDV27DRAFT_135855 [Aspergillus caelatus]|uniref:Uncharacterized protein n=1 Tax=Aspergillus caelatus TaxID=61420 RepID=A0A5N6ZRJ1_9EURO|nr:uncharacterized protein BDV27DRAFT_135855 [Aspergillus caelatus]KAE8359576.1 hypothetical protein BDV27DRAFT_135855 [Aspergillus caelatus]